MIPPSLRSHYLSGNRANLFLIRCNLAGLSPPFLSGGHC